MKSLKACIRAIKPCVLRGVGKRRRFVEVTKPARKGVKATFGVSCRGLTSRLAKHLYSRGTLPSVSRQGDGSRFCGQKRGKLVDTQIGSIANGRRPPAKPYQLTQLLLAYFEKHKIQLLGAQVAGMRRANRLATAADLVAKQGNELLVIELKCGHVQGRTAAAILRGKTQTMKGPLKKATDCVLHRHFSQLSATMALLAPALSSIAKRHEFAIKGVVLYANQEGITAYTLPKWWARRGLLIASAV